MYLGKLHSEGPPEVTGLFSNMKLPISHREGSDLVMSHCLPHLGKDVQVWDHIVLPVQDHIKHLQRHRERGGTWGC